MFNFQPGPRVLEGGHHLPTSLVIETLVSSHNVDCLVASEVGRLFLAEQILQQSKHIRPL